ncbi:MAG: hypothetical protein ACFFFK_07565 [Candidatus Thorarchaeota archaeon]
MSDTDPHALHARDKSVQTSSQPSAANVVRQDDGYYHSYCKYALQNPVNDSMSNVFPSACCASVLAKTIDLIHIGGFDGTTSFAADKEMMRRLNCNVAIDNVPEFLYHRYLHKHSLSFNVMTGYGSTARHEYDTKITNVWTFAQDSRSAFGSSDLYAGFVIPRGIKLDTVI